ncbi:HNH endonuclease [Arcobacter sp. F155]|uniref:HNH endonuclease n=1 Tax=Arcobacter sp. F155 TaxID=2044512 RepID=UPI00100C012D|nr:HNH endonuclease [Arcobacter sp. F155]RXJ76997.1 HNH endonuclease [Arcobacter sp. F155]
MIKISRQPCPYPDALINGNYKHHRNKLALKESSFDKCMYCESKISHIDFAHVEHIKPKAEGKYPELEFEWSNLGYACPKCNNEKSDKYHDDLPYINPYEDDPKEHLFAAGTFLFVKNGSERGEMTIRDINLNRPEIIEKRLERINEIQKALNACFRTNSESLKDVLLQELRREANDDKEYSLFITALLDAHAV